jgi:hypothetical protein
MSLVMSSQMAGSHDAEDLPNEVCASHNSNRDAKMLMNQHSIPIDPLQGSDVYFREPASIGTDYSAGAHSDADLDISVLLDSNSIDMGHGVAHAESSSGSMVTGLGGDAGITNLDQAPFQFNPGNVYEDGFDTMMRDLVTSDFTSLGSTADVGFPDPEFLKFIDSGAQSLAESLSTPMNSDLINGFDGMSIQPIQAGSTDFVGESIQEQSTTGDNLDIIKMMNVQLKPSAPASLTLGSNHMVPKGYIPSPAAEHVPCSPAPPYTPATPGVPIQASVPKPLVGPGTPQTPKTPCCVQKGPFELKTYEDGEERIVQISVRSGLSFQQRQLAMQALLFSQEEHLKIKECVGGQCDLKVAVDAKAELVGSKMDVGTAALQFTMPKECKYGLCCLCGVARYK